MSPSIRILRLLAQGAVMTTLVTAACALWLPTRIVAAPLAVAGLQSPHQPTCLGPRMDGATGRFAPRNIKSI